MLGSLQMWRQTHIAACALALLHAGCGQGTRGKRAAAPLPGATPARSTAPRLPDSAEGAGGEGDGGRDSPDLLLRDVAFARLVGGRVVASGAADELRYHRSGGRFEATQGRARVLPGPGAEALRSLGEVRLTAPVVQGEMQARRATASGGVAATAARGDTARTDRATLDGKSHTLSGDRPIDTAGPGYLLRGHNFLARTDGSRVVLGGGASGTLLPAAAADGRARP